MSDHECPEDERCPECGSMPADMIGDMVSYGTTAREYTTIMAALKRSRDEAQLTETHGDPLLRKDAA